MVLKTDFPWWLLGLRALGEAFTDDSPPAAILSANIGCISHLQAGTSIPVRHWVEVLDEALAR